MIIPYQIILVIEEHNRCSGKVKSGATTGGEARSDSWQDFGLPARGLQF
jgi:hypothetical protein